MNYVKKQVVLPAVLLAGIFLSNAFCAEMMIEWKFENNINDSSGNGINGFEYNDPAYTSAGVLDYALVSDGSDCAYKTGLDPNDIPVDGGDSWTVNIWVCPDDQPGDWHVLWAMGNKPFNASSRSVYSNSAGKIVFTDGSGLSGHYLVTDAPFDVGQWQMITATYDGVNVKLYKNAALIGTMAFTFTDAPGEFRIPSNPGWGSYMSGLFDELTIWDDALTQAEILDLIVPGVLTEIELASEIVHYEMSDMDSAGLVPDHSLNSNDGQFTTTSGVALDWIDAGVIGDCLVFDGGQKITVPATVSQNAQFAVAFWFNAGWQAWDSAFYHEKGSDGSEFIIRGDGSRNIKIYSKDMFWATVFSMTTDFGAYLDRSWNHMAVVSDGHTVSLYVNGKIIDSAGYLKVDYKTSMTGYIGYQSGQDYLGSDSYAAYVDEFQLFKGFLTQPEIQAMIAKGNFDFDRDVDIDDLRILASNWLTDTVISGGNELVVDNFELGVLAWQVYPSSNYSGTGTIAAATNAFEGIGAMSWDYDLPATTENNNYTSIITDLGAPTDFSGYDQMSLKLYRHSSNTEESILYLKLYDPNSTENPDITNCILIAESSVIASDCVSEPSDQWEQWLIDLSDLLGPGGSGTVDQSELTGIQYVLIGCGSWERKDARSGTIDIDDIKLISMPLCSSYPTGDLNGDCKVNMNDLSEFAHSWMLGLN